MAGLLLDRCDSFGLFAPHAVFCQQSHAPRSRRRRKLQQERLVAGSIAIDGLGRKLAQKPPLQSGLGAPWITLVSTRHRMVLDLRSGIGRPRQQYKTTQSAAIDTRSLPAGREGMNIWELTLLVVLPNVEFTA